MPNSKVHAKMAPHVHIAMLRTHTNVNVIAGSRVAIVNYVIKRNNSKEFFFVWIYLLIIPKAPCDSKPCENGATCTITNTNRGYTCMCDSALFTGSNCESSKRYWESETFEKV